MGRGRKHANGCGMSIFFHFHELMRTLVLDMSKVTHNTRRPSILFCLPT